MSKFFPTACQKATILADTADLTEGMLVVYHVILHPLEARSSPLDGASV